MILRILELFSSPFSGNIHENTSSLAPLIAPPTSRVGRFSDSCDQIFSFPRALKSTPCAIQAKKTSFSTWNGSNLEDGPPKGSGYGTPSLHGHKWLINVGWSEPLKLTGMSLQEQSPPQDSNPIPIGFFGFQSHPQSRTGSVVHPLEFCLRSKQKPIKAI